LYEEKITKLGRREKLANRLIVNLYSNPVISPREAERKLEVTPATANRLLSEMEKIGLIKERTGFSRNRLYELHEYLDIFRK
jgi:DNA-binding MarR family transcriptional regulator